MNDLYCNPGPVQFEGDLKYHLFKSLRVMGNEYLENVKNFEQLAEKIKSLGRFGTHPDILKIGLGSLENLENILMTMKDNFKN